MNYKVEDYKRNVVEHYSRIWGNDFQERQWSKGPISEVVPHFLILEFKPNATRQMWTYATCGMSTFTHIFPIEVHIFSSVRDDSILELLSTVCYYHNVEANINLGHTINFGRPWQEQSESSYAVLSLPYLDGPDLEVMTIGDYKDVHFFWLIPITEEEVEYKKKYGFEALESKLEEKEFNYLNPNRNSVI